MFINSLIIASQIKRQRHVDKSISPKFLVFLIKRQLGT